MSVPGFTNGGAALKSRPAAAKISRTPGLVLHPEQLGMGCIGVFGDALSAQPVQQEFRQIDPGKILFLLSDPRAADTACSGQDLNSGQFVEALRRNPGVHLLLRFHGAFVAITKRIGHRLSVRRPGAHSPPPSRPRQSRRFLRARVARRRAGLLPRPCRWRQYPSEDRSRSLLANWRSGEPDGFPVGRRPSAAGRHGNFPRPNPRRPELASSAESAVSSGAFRRQLALRSCGTSFIAGKPRSVHRPPG